MGKRAWLAFATIQVAGCIFVTCGTSYSESPIVRWSWLIGFVLLLPGNLAANTVAPMLIHVPSAYALFPVAILSNAIAWTTCAAAWWTIRRQTAKNSVPPMRHSLKITSILGLLILLSIAAMMAQQHREAAAVSQLYSNTISIKKGAPRIPISTLGQLTSADFTIVTDLRNLPPPVKESFCNVETCNFGATHFDMVNPGETMSTDYVLPGVPNKRLVFAALNTGSAIVVYERGGFANLLRTIVLDFKSQRTWDTTLNSHSIKNLRDLRVALDEEK